MHRLWQLTSSIVDVITASAPCRQCLFTSIVSSLLAQLFGALEAADHRHTEQEFAGLGGIGSNLYEPLPEFGLVGLEVLLVLNRYLFDMLFGHQPPLAIIAVEFIVRLDLAPDVDHASG